MEKLLIICEKPSAARAFSEALGGKSGTFEGDQYVITNLYGHIMELGKPAEVAVRSHKETVGDFSNVAGIPWSPDYFDFNNKKLKVGSNGFDGYKQAYSVIDNHLKNGFIPVIASDIDTYGEGDLLVQEVIDSCGYKGKRYREYHTDETPKNITKALREKKEVTAKDPAYMTGWTRSACDFLTQQYTRVATIAIQQKGYKLPSVVPFGRLQSAIVTIVGQQIDAIKAYKPSSVWESRYKLDNLILTAPDLPQFATKEEWEAGGLPLKADVKKVKEVPGTTKPPKPLNLTKLSALMSAQGVSVKRTLELAQKLYENGDGSGRNYMSYPRTEEDYVTSEQFQEMLPYIDQYIDLLGLPKAVFTHRQPRPTHVKDSGAHGALRPGAIPKSLDELDAKFGKGAGAMYKLVTERFLLMFLEDTEWIRHEYETVGTTPTFTGSVKIITKQGVTDPDAEPEDVSTTLPDTSKQAELYPHEVKSTKPANPTTAWLLKQLIKHNVGTPATQAKTVADMTGATDKHPLKDGKVLALTAIGYVGYEAAKGTLIGSIEGTRFMHDCITAVRKGTFTPEQAMAKFSEAITKDVEILRTKSYDLDALGFEKQKPRDIVTGTWQGKPTQFNRQYSSHKFTDDEVQRLLNDETIDIEITTEKGTFKVRGKLEEQEYKGRIFVGFKGEFIRDDIVKGIWQGKEVQFKNSFGGYKYTQAEIDQLLANQTITITTEKGTYTGKLEIQEYQGRKFVGFKPQFPKKEGYIYGNFKGKEISFKGEFMGHTFTPDEVDRLLAGNKIVFQGKSKAGKEMTVGGGIELQTYQGRQFYGFKPEFDNKKGGFGN